jgi:hypothetical protein
MRSLELLNLGLVVSFTLGDLFLMLLLKGSDLLGMALIRGVADLAHVGLKGLDCLFQISIVLI